MIKTIFYHSDSDGYCSAAIARTMSYSTGNLCAMIPVGYSSIINEESYFGNNVIMVDFHLPAEKMIDIYKKSASFIWVDHHQTSLRTSRELESVGIHIGGIRSDECSASMLSWKYFISNTRSVPNAVKYIDSYDTWKWKNVKNSIEFEYGLRTFNPDPAVSMWFWDAVLGNDEKCREIIEDQIISRGKYAFSYQREQDRRFSLSMCYYLDFCDNLFIARNIAGNSISFDSVIDKFPDAKSLLTYCNKKHSWCVSMYNIDGRDGPDLSLIAERFGGGGHKNAAGFHTDNIDSIIGGTL